MMPMLHAAITAKLDDDALLGSTASMWLFSFEYAVVFGDCTKDSDMVFPVVLFIYSK